MSSEELSQQIGEQNLGAKTNGVGGLLIAIGLKYGLPSLTCIYLFYVIAQKDQIITSMVRETTAALVSSTNAGRDQADAMNRLSDAIRTLQK